MTALVRKSRNYLFPVSSCKSLVYFSTNSASVYDYLIHKYQFSPQTVARVASVFASRKVSKSPTDSLVLSFLKETGFSNAQLENAVKFEPRLLSLSLERTVKPKIKIFQDLGYSATDIAEIFGNNPLIFQRNATRCIIPSLGVYEKLFGTNARVATLLKKPGWSLFVDVEKALLPNIELLKRCGVPMEQVNSFVYTNPIMFLVNPEKMKKSVEKVDEIGVERTSKMFIHAVRVGCSISDVAWKRKMQMFKDLGFSEDDILRMLRSAPIVLTISRERIENVTKVILETGKYDMSCIIKWPASLMYSFEKRFKPRLQVLGVLDKKNLIKKWPALGTLCKMTDDKFFRKYVVPSMEEVDKGSIAKTAVTAKA